MEYTTVQGVAEKTAIPIDAKKPKDSRYKSNDGSYNSIVQSFQTTCGNEEMLEKIIEFFPYPIQVYSLDGTLILTNKACLNIFRFSKDDVIGKFNVLEDSIIDKWGDGVKECIKRSFQGEIVQFFDLKMPIQDIIERFDKKELSSDSIFQNITCFPIYNNNQQLAYVVNVFITSKLYSGKEEINRGKEYIDNHWQEIFNINATAKAAGLSNAHFIRVFKADTGFTPHEYYTEIKFNKIKEKLLDLNLSVSQVFSECGIDYNGHYANVFKKRIGTTPSQYRKNGLK